MTVAITYDPRNGATLLDTPSAPGPVYQISPGATARVIGRDEAAGRVLMERIAGSIFWRAWITLADLAMFWRELVVYEEK